MNRHAISIVASILFAAAPSARGQQSLTQQTKSPDTTQRPFAKEAIEHYNKAVKLHQSAFLNQAITEYQAAIDADDRIHQAWSNLGGIYLSQKLYSKAIAAYEKATSLYPNSTTTLNGYATVLYAIGKTDEAIAKWRQLVELDPTFTSASYNLAFALEHSGHHEDAQAVLRKAGLIDKDGKPIEPRDNQQRLEIDNSGISSSLH